jgi:spermidine synthase
MRPWAVIDRVEGRDGALELRHRGADDFVIALGGRILMTSRASHSEARLGTLVATRLPASPAPRLLIGGLGLGLSLRAALAELPPRAAVEVVELNAVVLEWCRGPLAGLTGNAIADRRVRVVVGDVAERIRAASTSPGRGRFEGIALDLYEGVRPTPRPADDPVYGTAALARAHAALTPGGVFGRWSEQPDAAFARRLARAGFAVQSERLGTGGRRHAVCLGVARPVNRSC